MSHTGSHCLLFESFLQKRKDTMKLLWVTYWFRLQNTTLFFYTKKHGNASHLRGHYYIYSIQSVREVQNGDSKRFMFEIIMTSGKRKMLAADTATLRKEWVGYLWQAMHLSTSGIGMLQSKEPEESVQQETDDTYINREALFSDVQCTNASPTSSGPLYPNISASTSDEPIYQNAVFQCSTDNTGSQERNNEDVKNTQEGDYDVLPVRNNLNRTNPCIEIDDGVYECPISYRTPTDQEESPYDIPSALLRKLPSDNIVSEPDEELYWKISKRAMYF